MLSENTQLKLLENKGITEWWNVAAMEWRATKEQNCVVLEWRNDGVTELRPDGIIEDRMSKWRNFAVMELWRMEWQGDGTAPWWNDGGQNDEVTGSHRDGMREELRHDDMMKWRNDSDGMTERRNDKKYEIAK